MLGLPITDLEGSPNGRLALKIVAEMLQLGYILLFSGVQGYVLGFFPPFTASKNQFNAAVDALESILKQVSTT
jgi:4-aminobutyrate aminotransferase-like enzyme